MGGGTTFNPFQSAQYGEFLYYLSNKAYHCGDIEIAEKTYYLNKMLNGVDWFYEVELPDIFFADHPMGSVLGRAKYSNYLSVGKNVTVGNNKGIYPVIGENVVFHQNAFICGNCNIGHNVEVSVGVFIKDTDIPSNSLVFGASPNLIIKTFPEEEMLERLTLFIR